MSIGKLRSHGNKEIARLAAELVSKWRKNVELQKAAKGGKSGGVGVNSPSANTPSSASSPAPPSSISNKPYEGDTEKRHFRTDNVNLSRTGNKTRDNSIGLMYNGLAYRATESVDEVLVKAVEVEQAVFAKFKSSESTGYRAKLRSLFANLKRKDNMQLGRQIRSGTIVPEILITMTEQELAPEQKAKDDLLARENMMKAQVPMAEKSISTALRCGKCGQKKVSYSQAQTRSADEPMTTFCECINCGNRWKVNNHPLARLDSWERFADRYPKSSRSHAYIRRPTRSDARLSVLLDERRRDVLLGGGTGTNPLYPLLIAPFCSSLI